MGGAQVNAYRDTACVRIRRLPGFGNLEESHKKKRSGLGKLIQSLVQVLQEFVNKHERSTVANGQRQIV